MAQPEALAALDKVLKDNMKHETKAQLAPDNRTIGAPALMLKHQARRVKVWDQALLALILLLAAPDIAPSQHEPSMTVAQYKALDTDDQYVYLVELTRKWGPQFEKQRPKLKTRLHKYLFVSEDGSDYVRIGNKNVQFGEVVYDIEYSLATDILKYELEAGVVYTATGSVRVKPVDIESVSMDDVLKYVVAKFPSWQDSDQETESEEMAVPDSTAKPTITPSSKIRPEDIDKISPLLEEPDSE